MTRSGDTAEATTNLPAAVGAVLAAFWAHGGQHTARSNAWQAVRADQIHAAERAEANHALDALAIRHDDSPDSHNLTPNVVAMATTAWSLRPKASRRTQPSGELQTGHLKLGDSDIMPQ